MAEPFRTEDGTKYHAEDYLYVGDPQKPETWAERVNDAAHVRDAMARFDQTEKIPAAEKPAAARKLVAVAKRMDIDPSGFAKSHNLSALAAALPRIELSRTRADGLTRIPILRLGEIVYEGRAINITAEMVRQMVLNAAATSVEVPLSYEHTIEHPEAALGQPIPRAGGFQEFESTADANGVWWGWCQLTDRSRDLIAAGEYAYTSASFGAQDNVYTGKDQGFTLFSVALTNRPYLDMPKTKLSAAGAEINNKEKTVGKPAFKKTKVSAITDGPQKGNLLLSHDDFPQAKNADDDQPQYYADMSDVKKAVGAAADLSGADRDRIGKVVLLSGVAGATTLTDEVVTAIGAKVSAAGNARPVVELSAVPKDEKGNLDLARLVVPQGANVSGEAFRAMQADMEFSAALGAGRVLPAEREHFRTIALSDINLFRSMLAVRQPVVSLSASGSGGSGSGRGGDAVELTRAEKDLAKKMGLSLDKVLASKRQRVAETKQDNAAAQDDDE